MIFFLIIICFIHTNMHTVVHCLRFRNKKRSLFGHPSNFVEIILRIELNHEASIVNQIESWPECIITPRLLYMTYKSSSSSENVKKIKGGKYLCMVLYVLKCALFWCCSVCNIFGYVARLELNPVWFVFLMQRFRCTCVIKSVTDTWTFRRSRTRAWRTTALTSSISASRLWVRGI